MNRLLLTLLAIVMLGVGANAQQKKAGVKRSTIIKQAPEKVDSVALLEKNAEKWFREVYVEKNFVDPYSYRLVKLISKPISNKQLLEIDLATVQSRIDTCSLADVDRSVKALEETESDIKELDDLKVKVLEELSKATTDREKLYLNKKVQIIVKALSDLSSLKTRMAVYHLDCKMKEIILKTMSSMSEEELSQIIYRDMHLDCYSKNDQGNEVLGRFIFPYNRDGVFRGESNVRKIN